MSLDRNRRQIHTTEAAVSRFCTTTKVMLTHFDREKVHQLIDMLADEVNQTYDPEKGYMNEPITAIPREWGDTEKEIIKELSGDNK